MSILTSTLTRLVELSHLSLIYLVLTLCTILVITVLLFWYRDHRIFSESDIHLFPSTPQTDLRKVELPVSVTSITSKSVSEEGFPEVNFKVKVLEDDILYRAFWGVSVSGFHHILKSPWTFFREAYLRGNLFGASACIFSTEVRSLSPNDSTHDITEKLAEHVSLNLGSAPRETYPLVLCFAMPEKFGTDTGIGAMLLVIHIRDDVCRIPTRTLYSYLKHNTSVPGVTSLVPTYGFDENSDNETLCAVCQEKPVTRVILPCRHACTCGMCFDMLNRRCPLCRTTIQSFFVTADEAKFETEEDSREVHEEPRSWRRTFDELNHRYAMAMGLQENQ